MNKRSMQRYGAWPNPDSVKAYAKKLNNAVKALEILTRDKETLCANEQSIYIGMILTLGQIRDHHYHNLDHCPANHLRRLKQKLRKQKARAKKRKQLKK